MDTETIIVTWMDDRIEIYPAVTHTVRDGVLHLTQYADGSRGIITGKWHIPLASIRTYEPEGNP